MAQTEGERELVLGNKQLVTFFFVALALCGVFFALGYTIGRNSSRTGVASLEGTPPAASDSTAGQRSQDSDLPRETAHEAVREDSPRTPDAAPVAQDNSPVPVAQTQPAHEAPARTETAALQSATATTTPQPGATYLQVAAQRRSDADNLVKTLREQAFPAILAESSKPDLFRVLVGPYHKTADVADAKARLKTLGFANAFVMK